MRFKLLQSDRLTVVSDGVVEAANKDHELYGFARTAAMATRPAAEIAEAAQSWGQEDDITVLTLTRLATALGGTPEARPAPSPALA